MTLSPNMRLALAAVIKADPQPLKTCSSALIKGCEALERRGLVRYATMRRPFEAPEFELTDAGRLMKTQMGNADAC